MTETPEEETIVIEVVEETIEAQKGGSSGKSYPKSKKNQQSKKKKGKLNFRPINPPENRRVYQFPMNQHMIVEGVCAIAVTDIGTHRLCTTKGERYIIPAGWIGLRINAPGNVEDWPF